LNGPAKTAPADNAKHGASSWTLNLDEIQSVLRFDVSKYTVTLFESLTGKTTTIGNAAAALEAVC
jgi:hypothetical protein